MEFSTAVKPHSYPFNINHQDKIFTIGSCFSENIGKKFSENKFQIQINPFGQQYNPASIAQGIDRIIHSKYFTDDDIIFRDELYHCWQHHSDFSKPDKKDLLAEINDSLQQNLEYLKTTDYLFITFGTSHIFQWKLDGRIVSNCHKISGSEFDFRFLSSDEIVELINNCLNDLKTINDKVKIILTISPVRYLAFGFFENNLSKANLFVAIDKLLKERNDCFYFPAYEIVMDELRDYRFFAEDMLHPNHQASQYVWEKMCSMMMPKETIDLMYEIYKITAAVNHKPRNNNSAAHKKFIQNTIEKIFFLQKKSGITNWEIELEKLNLKS